RDMDEKSRMVIESMLAEEAFYSGRSSTISPGMQRIVSSPSRDSRLNAKLSSADLPSHNTRWTIEEDARLRQGIDTHGYGNWKAIAAIVGTRNPLQVKNHARHLAMSEKMTNSPKERRTVSFGAVHVAELKPDTNSYDEDDMNSSEDGGVDGVRSTSGSVVMPSPLSKASAGEQFSIFTSSHSPMVNDNNRATETSSPSSFQEALSRDSCAHTPRTDDDNDEGEGFLGSQVKRLQHQEVDTAQPSSSLPMTTSPATLPSHYEIVTPPSHAHNGLEGTKVTPSAMRRILDKSVITEEEKQVHSEFFCNKASKTPERYQRIRNTILQAWERSPSTYLTKTSVRSGLKDCGDVNAIGRVHSWLESIGAINVGMTASSPGASLARPRNGGNISELVDLDSIWVTPPLRRRRVRDERGEWVDPKELEGRVIEHNISTSEFLPVNKRVPKNKRAQHLIRQARGSHEYQDDEESSGGYDPFRLVPLRKYNAQNPAPFRVKISSDAMLIMDFHSHMAETEVIGLLGGLYDEDERILFILSVYPCRSISTGLQCEMDPESDVEARYFFSSKGFVVVGWYHSHPTFEPNPSIRDIENQCEHQAMFRRHSTGVEPFVGVIVSPFDPRNQSFLSKFQFLTVSEQLDERLGCRVPFGFDREITRTNEISVAVFQQLSELVRYYRMYEHKVDLSKLLRRGELATRLDKLLQSLSHHVFVDENTARAFLSKVKELVVRGFHLSVDHDRVVSSSATSLSSSEAPSLQPSSLPPVSSTRRMSFSTAGFVMSSAVEPPSTRGSGSAMGADTTSQVTSRSESNTTTSMDGVEVQQAVPESTTPLQ
ncbi:MAG: hypothetical protein J3Q66DRAFT_277514, partial [Benniella sp.]